MQANNSRHDPDDNANIPESNFNMIATTTATTQIRPFFMIANGSPSNESHHHYIYNSEHSTIIEAFIVGQFCSLGDRRIQSWSETHYDTSSFDLASKGLWLRHRLSSDSESWTCNQVGKECSLASAIALNVESINDPKSICRELDVPSIELLPAKYATCIAKYDVARFTYENLPGFSIDSVRLQNGSFFMITTFRFNNESHSNLGAIHQSILNTEATFCTKLFGALVKEESILLRTHKWHKNSYYLPSSSDVNITKRPSWFQPWDSPESWETDELDEESTPKSTLIRVVCELKRRKLSREAIYEQLKYNPPELLPAL
jgi:hypothetical protein